MQGVRVNSEIGPLQAVLVHTPGRELIAVTPGTRQDYLYDDIIDLVLARREHGILVSVLKKFAEVYEVSDLLTDVLKTEAVRKYLVSHTMDVVPSDSLAKRLSSLPPTELADLLIEGEKADPGPIGSALNEPGYSLPAVPNLYFTRDVGIVIGSNVVVGSMRHGVRWTEEMIIRTIFEHHPLLENEGIVYDGSEERRHDYTLEGGDVHPLRNDLLVVGFSDRSSPAALDLLCERVFEKGIRDVIVVAMPRRQEAIHLDMVFTQIDRELCVVSPPHFLGPSRLPVLHRSARHSKAVEKESLFDALKEVDYPIEPIMCGGESRGVQEREQWASGCNMITVRPGVALAYARNGATLDELSKAGFRVVDGTRFLANEDHIGDGERAVITFVGSELVRGGGGPRCMTMPIRRGDV